MLKTDIVTRFSDRGEGVENEDVLGSLAATHHADFWIVDGATSVADEQYIRRHASDSGWHANFLSTRFAYYAQQSLAIREVIERAIADVALEYRKETYDVGPVPGHAWPLAAVSYVRIAEYGEDLAIQCVALGDCPVSIVDGEGRELLAWEPGIAPAEKWEQSGALSRTALKQRIRERRLEQHHNPRSAIAGLDPASVQHAKSLIARAPTQVQLILASDGITRLYNDYAVLSRKEFMTQALDPRTAVALLERLRAFEKTGQTHHYKQRDDASMMVARVRRQHA